MAETVGTDRDTSSAWKLICAYWQIYGGFREIFKSIYFRLALVVWVFSFSSWTRSGWWDTVFQILPNLLGFTLGGYALTLTIGNDTFRGRIVDAVDTKGDSILANLSATFVHFVITQVIALLLALLAKSLCFSISDYSNWLNLLLSGTAYGLFSKIINTLFWGISYLIFLYSICISGAACLCIFRLGLFLNKMHEKENEHEDINNRGS